MVISPLPLIFPPALFAHLRDQEDQNLINTRVFSINELGENDFVKFQLISITSGNVFFTMECTSKIYCEKQIQILPLFYWRFILLYKCFISKSPQCINGFACLCDVWWWSNRRIMFNLLFFLVHAPIYMQHWQYFLMVNQCLCLFVHSIKHLAQDGSMCIFIS